MTNVTASYTPTEPHSSTGSCGP